jgi:hypothetical protein
MLKIRPEQYEVFKPIAEEVFVQDVVEYLRNGYGQRRVQLPDGSYTIDSLPVARLNSMVKGGFARARQCGLTGKSALIAYVVLMFLTAPNFDKHPLIQHVLTDNSIPPDARLAELWQRTTDQNWVAVRRSYDPGAWEAHMEAGNEH